MSDLKETLQTTLQQLSEAVGVSGSESEVRKLILNLIKDHVENVTIDPMGNVTAQLKLSGERQESDSPRLRVMIAAHMDESGFMVKEIGENGLISVVDVGPHDHRALPTQRVWVGEAKTPGVLIWPPIHKSYGKNDIQEVTDMHIDVGADNKGAVKAKPGERVAFMSAFTALSADVVRGKAFESRTGCAVLIALVEMLTTAPLVDELADLDIYVVFTAQENIGARGSYVASYRIAPDAAIAVRAVETNDIPIFDPDDDSADRAPRVSMGGGPVLSFLDPALIADHRLTELLRDTADEIGVAYQVDVQALQRSKRENMSLARAGVPTAAVALPVRYLRTSNALVALDDLVQTVHLLHTMLSKLNPELLTR